MTTNIAMATEQAARHLMFVSSLAFLPFGFGTLRTNNRFAVKFLQKKNVFLSLKI